MKVNLPAMRGQMGGREYFSAVVSLAELRNLFTFNPVEMPPEQRQQRSLNKGRVPLIARYIIENEEGYLFSSIVASYQGKAKFSALNEAGNLGSLEMDLTESKFIINDGQHRTAGIAEALKQNPDLASQTINVLFFPYESVDRMQQMFSDLNRYVVRTPKALNILFDKRDELAAVTLEVVKEVEAFNGWTDKERVTLASKSTNLFTLLSIYQATGEFLGPLAAQVPLASDQIGRAVDFWSYIAEMIPDWGDVAGRRKLAAEVRMNTISTHSVVLSALAAVSGEVQAAYPTDWEDKLGPIKDIDWRKINPEWANVVIVGGSVITNRAAGLRMRELLWRKLGLSKTAAAEPATTQHIAVKPVVVAKPEPPVSRRQRVRTTSAVRG